MMVSVKQFIVGPVQTNCYFVVNEETKEMFCVDPGENASRLIREVAAGGYHPVAVLLTHGHFDHVTGAKAFADEYQIPIYIHEAEARTLKDPELNASWMLRRPMVYTADRFLKDREELEVAGIKTVVLFTPGHTPGGCCYYLPDRGIVFSGDSLFCQSIGRTDFPEGSMAQLVDAVMKQLMTLPGDVVVYPGHNEATTIAFERENNPFL